MTSTTSGVTAVRAEGFVQSIGVNTHMSWQDPGYSWATPAYVESAMAYLGVYHIRDAAPLSWTLGEYQALANMGVKFDLLTNGGNIDFGADLAGVDSLARSNPGSVTTIEGPNEINLSPIVFNGVNSANNLSIGTAAQASLYGRVQSDPLLAGVKVVDLSLGVASQAQYNSLGNIASYADYGNFHIYFANGAPPAALMAGAVAEAQSTTPGKPVMVTETGYYTAPNATDWGGVNQDVQAKQTLDALLDAYKDGSSTTFLYALMDNLAYPASNDREDSFGLFNGDGTPKEAATALHDLTAILADTANNAQSFAAGSLPYTLSNLPATGNSLLMQKASGVFDLVVWNEPVLWNEATLTERTIAPTNVTVNLGKTFTSVSVFDPLAGTQAIATYSNVASLVVGLSDHPLVIQCSGAATTSGGGGGPTTGGGGGGPTTGGGGTTYTLGAAGGTVHSTGADHVTTGSGAATVTASSNATITGGSGSLSVALTGSGASVAGGPGNLTLTDAMGGNTIVTGSGINTATITGGGDSIVTNGWDNALQLGTGASTITVFGDAQIVGGSGNAVIAGRGSWISATTGTGRTSVTFLSGAGYVQTYGTDTINASGNSGGSISIDAEGPSTSVAGGRGGLYFVGNGNATVTTGTSGTSTFAPTGGHDVFKSYAGTTNTFVLGAGTAVVNSGGRDTVYGGSGAATVAQRTDSTQLLIHGGSGALVVDAGSGNTSLVGGSGPTSVVGGRGTLEMTGGSGTASVQFGKGAATVAAGSGSDLFTFGNGMGGGSALIEDFQPGLDHLHLSGYQANQAATAVAGGVANAAGFTMKLADGTTITIAGTSHFSTSNFV
jgi:hypothetical protein